MEWAPSKGIGKGTIMGKGSKDTLPFPHHTFNGCSQVLFTIVIVRYHFWFQNHLVTQHPPALETAQGFDDRVVFGFGLSSTWVTRNIAPLCHPALLPTSRLSLPWGFFPDGFFERQHCLLNYRDRDLHPIPQLTSCLTLGNRLSPFSLQR